MPSVSNNLTALLPHDTLGGLLGQFPSFAADGASLTSAAHLLSTGTAPTIAAGANAGTSPPTPTVTGTDVRGVAAGGTGTSAAAGALLVVTFATAFAAAPIVTISPLNAASAALVPYITSVSTTAFTIAAQGTPTSSQGATVFQFAYHAIG